MSSISLRHVAERAGVSGATASRVLNGKQEDRIPPQTRERVRRAARELGYQPNPLAQRLLKKQTTRTIGLLLSDLENPFFQEVFAQIDKAVMEAGYQIMLDVNTSNYGEYHELGRLSSWLVDGVLMWTKPEITLADYLGPQAASIPVVYLGHHRDDDTDTASFDLHGAGRQAAAYLVGRSYRRLCYVSLLSRTHLAGETQHQLPAMLDVFGEAGLELEVICPKAKLELTSWAFQTGREIAGRPNASRPDAVICYNDFLALNVYHGLLAGGVRVPDDVALMGFDGIQMTKFLPPGPLTTVRMPVDALCRAASDILWRRIAGDRETPSQQILIPTELIPGATA